MYIDTYFSDLTEKDRNEKFDLSLFVRSIGRHLVRKKPLY